MATVPTTFTAAVLAKIKAAVWNTYVRDAFAFLLSVPRCYVYQTATTSLTTAVLTLLTWDTELYDTDNMHSTTTNTSRIVANAAGLYHVKVQVAYQASSAGVRTLQVRKNAAGSSTGGTQILVCQDSAITAGTSILNGSVEVQLAAGDYLEVFASQTSGGTLTTSGGQSVCFCSARWVANS